MSARPPRVAEWLLRLVLHPSDRTHAAVQHVARGHHIRAGLSVRQGHGGE